MKQLNEHQMRMVLRKACKEAGSQKIWAERNKLSRSFVSEVLKGRRGFSKKLLDTLGYAEEKYYRVSGDSNNGLV